ncbi:hypothetical protein BC939DRAFT_502895 [Gamsiella multidivaricata]|uniref:uncharacterized protein n=1 Tax=Gamsiella multidivaricata TaxID=101098 RepID=UPI002220C893|nr:uncharacterized protein BC939DRAFT_502895 [Gamsiella multidivaricata]KAG0365246.1 hypothetical protein BGZ54_006737 [Gamsiella multidivaricata]KAI7824087.1 hypothetical protein BC939DRAFT_502895 [Gamsiella multidivaricata]
MSSSTRKSSRVVRKATLSVENNQNQNLSTKPQTETPIASKKGTKTNHAPKKKPSGVDPELKMDGSTAGVSNDSPAVAIPSKSKKNPGNRKRKINIVDTDEDVKPRRKSKTKKDDAMDMYVEVKPKRKGRKKEQETGSAIAPAIDHHQPSQISPDALPQLQCPVNRSDPCSLFPTEVWHQILAILPLSQVAKISIVSKTWLDGSRLLPIWKTVCEKNRLGEPKKKYRSHMALVCSKSYWICDRCQSYSNGKPRGSDLPLPIANQDDQGLVWMLCHSCREQYYDRWEEPLREGTDLCEHEEERITKTYAKSTYYIPEEKLDSMEYELRPNPHSWSAPPMRLYDTIDVQSCAVRYHAGWVGVEACQRRLAKKRSAASKERDTAFKGVNIKGVTTKGTAIKGATIKGTAA